MMPEVSASKYRVSVGWDDTPHLDEKTKRELLEGTLPHLRAARSRGEPGLGAGAIYPIAVEDITVEPFAIPKYYPRAYGMDVGWNRTAAIWGAKDRESGVIYAYTEHYMGRALPAIHATAIKARGNWIRGTIDPASRTSSQTNGEKLLELYKDEKLRLRKADNSVEAGIYEVWTALSTGRLKIFSTLQYTLQEYRIYQRDEDGKVVKKNDHLMDALRYLIVMFDKIARVQPVERTVLKGKPAPSRKANY